MRKILLAAMALLLAFLVSTSAFAEDSGSSTTLDKLLAQREEVDKAIALVEEDEIISKSIDSLKTYWAQEIYQSGQATGNGYLEIKYTRVIYIADTIPADLPQKAHDLFGNMNCFVEFWLLSDYLGAAPYYGRIGMYECVAFNKDGNFEVMRANPLSTYRASTYQTDFSGIIKRISDRNADFNRAFSLLEE